MFKKEILERLRKGEESTVIANELADALNAAVADYEAEVKAKEEQMRKEAELQVRNVFRKHACTLCIFHGLYLRP